ncbi:MAG TPA: hypothetical protein VFN78_03565 [Ktedonobacterales bacterium]|nr:hypothetical protein [Ktedonobacterales bacterium]
MKNALLAALDLALTALFIGGGLLLLAVGVWQGMVAHNAVTGIVLAVIGAALAGTPLSRLGRVRGVPRSERPLRILYWRTGVKPLRDNPSGMQTTFEDD